MADESKLELLIDIRSRLDELTKSTAELAKFRQEANGAGQALKTGFGIDIARRGLDLLTGTVREFAAEAFRMADQIKDVSQNLQLSTTAYQVLANVVRDAGGDVGLLSLAIANNNRSLVEARQINSAAAGAYRQLGLDVAKIEAMPVERRFEAIARAIAKSEDYTTAYGAASQILGSRNLPTLLGALRDLANDGYDKVADAAKKAGRVMEEDTIQRLERAKKTIEKLKQAATIAVGETIAVGDQIADSAKKDFWGTLRDIFAMGPMGMGSPALAIRLARDQSPAESQAAKPDPNAAKNLQWLREQVALTQTNIEQRMMTRQTLANDPTIDEIERKQRLVLALQAEIAQRRLLESFTAELPLDGESQLERDNKIFKIKEETLRLEKQLSALRTEGRVDAALNDFFEPIDRRTRMRDALSGASGYNDPNSNPNFMTPGQGAVTGAAEYVSELGSKGEQVANTLRSTLGAAVSGITEGIYGWITGTQSFSDVMLQLGGTILKTVLETIIQMGVQWLITQTLIKTGMISTHVVGEGLRAQRVAAATAEGTATTAAMAPAAATSSVASFGAAAVLGIAALLAVMAMFGGFETGGYTGDYPTNQIAGVVHGREGVLNAPAMSRLGIDNLNLLNAGASLDALNIPAATPASRVGAGAPLLSASGSVAQAMRREKPTQNFFVDSRSVVDRLRDDANFKVVVRDMIAGDPGYFGLPS